MIHDQVATCPPVWTTPNCAASATTKRASEITQTANVGALPEKLRRMGSPARWVASCLGPCANPMVPAALPGADDGDVLRTAFRQPDLAAPPEALAHAL